MLRKRFTLIGWIICLAPVWLISQNYNRGSLWAKDIEAFKNHDLIDFPGEGRILFLGSSSMRGWRNLEEDFPRHKVLNRAFGGSHLSDLIYYFSEIVLPYKPCQIFVYEGDNDIAGGMTPQQYLQDVITFVRMVEIMLPGTPVEFISTKPSPAREKWADKYKEANRLVRDFAMEKPNVRFIDVEQLMLNEFGEIIPEYFQNDRLHLNRKGYSLWAEIVRPYLSDKAIK